MNYKIYFILVGSMLLFCNGCDYNSIDEKQCEMLKHNAVDIVVCAFGEEGPSNYIYPVDFLEAVFIKHFAGNYVDFCSFLNQIIAGKCLINIEIAKEFNMRKVYNTEIWKEYEKYGLKYLRRKYLKRTKLREESYAISAQLNELEEGDLIRIFLINGYIGSFSDLTAQYIVAERSESMSY